MGPSLLNMRNVARADGIWNFFMDKNVILEDFQKASTGSGNSPTSCCADIPTEAKACPKRCKKQGNAPMLA
jgi:hypothetical protein